MNGLMVIGYISGLFGTAGWIKVFSHTEPKEHILSYPTWRISLDKGSSWSNFTVCSGRIQGKGLVAQFSEVSTRDEAVGLVGGEIAVERTQLLPLPEGQWYRDDLIGLNVHDQAGVCLGSITDIMTTPAHAVLVVEGRSRTLIPFVMGDPVKHVDCAAGVVSVDWESGFL